MKRIIPWRLSNLPPNIEIDNNYIHAREAWLLFNYYKRSLFRFPNLWFIGCSYSYRNIYIVHAHLPNREPDTENGALYLHSEYRACDRCREMPPEEIATYFKLLLNETQR